MSDLVERALELWGGPLPSGDEAITAFRQVYDDPVRLNGSPTPVSLLVNRARMTQSAFADLHYTVLQEVEAPGRVAFAFRIAGRHVGSLETPLGELAPTGRAVEVAGQDIFVVDEQTNRVTTIWAIADYLSLLLSVGAVTAWDAPPVIPSL